MQKTSFGTTGMVAWRSKKKLYTAEDGKLEAVQLEVVWAYRVIRMI